MDLYKAWLYRQGNWTEVDDPSAQFPEELNNVFQKLRYTRSREPMVYPVSTLSQSTMDRFLQRERAPIVYPDYPYYVEVEVVTDHYFYIADEPSYLQLMPKEAFHPLYK